MTRVEELTAKLARSQKRFLREADTVPTEQWVTRPEEGRWSAAELVAHLIAVETSVVAKADRVAQKTPKAIPLLKRMHLPMALVESRIIRRKSPVAVSPEMLREKEEMLAELRRARERSLAFLAEMRGRDLSGYYWQHPALGMLNTYKWMEFVAAHEVRHAKQMREIATGLPKVIENLQK
jgi:DinB superfamily